MDLIQKANRNIAVNFSHALKYSFIVTAYFVLIYIIARLTGLYKITELRYINYLMFFPVVWTALRKLHERQNHYIEYFNGFLISFLICWLGQLWFAVLFTVYLFVDIPFYNYLLNTFPSLSIMPRLSIFLIQLAEGAAIGAILSLAVMQYFKKKQGSWAFKSK